MIYNVEDIEYAATFEWIFTIHVVKGDRKKYRKHRLRSLGYCARQALFALRLDCKKKKMRIVEITEGTCTDIAFAYQVKDPDARLPEEQRSAIPLPELHLCDACYLEAVDLPGLRCSECKLKKQFLPSKP